MRSGGTPNFASTPASSSVSLLMVLISETAGVTSCARSLSPVEITTRCPLAAPTRASVPMASSASMPGTSSTGHPNRRTTSWMGPICWASASGMGGRWALYSPYQVLRKVSPLASNTQAAWAAGTCSRRRLIMATMPCTAPVGKPSGARRSGMAW